MYQEFRHIKVYYVIVANLNRDALILYSTYNIRLKKKLKFMHVETVL